MEYITNIPNRRTLRQILGGNDKKIAMGVAHAIAGDDTGDEQDTIFQSNRRNAANRSQKLEKIKNLSYTFAKTWLLTKGKLHDFYAQNLRGLLYNLPETSQRDLKLYYLRPVF